MRRALAAGVFACWLILGAVVAQEPAPANPGQDAPDAVEIVRPEEGVTLYGEIEIEASVTSRESISRVEFVVDGRYVGILTEPPWAITTDVGHRNIPHRIWVTAVTASGQRIEQTYQSRIIQVDETLDIDLRQLYVSVDRDGRRVTDLERDDFVIRDDGTKQELVTFERGDVPLTAVLLLDCSASMAGDRLRGALDGAKVFLKGMHELDEAKVVLFSDRLVAATPFGGDPEILGASLDGVRPDGGTAVNDFLYAGLKLLDERQGRRVVVLFTDGADVHSLLRMEEVLWKARRSQAMVFWIFLRGEAEEGEEDQVASFNSSWRAWEKNQREYELLRKAVEQSGGRVEVLDQADQLERAFARIIDELRNQYVLGYYPTKLRKDGSWHRIEVRASRGKVRAREGYVDF